MQWILIVDDDPGTRETFRKILGLEGFFVATAATGIEALQRLDRHAFDFIIADLLLPDISGVELLRRAKSSLITAPFAIISGFATVSSTVEAMQAGAVTCLEKPIEREHLIQVVRSRLHASVDTEAPVMAAAQRWAEMVGRALSAKQDPRTVQDWARISGQSRASLESRCRALAISPKESLDFTRMLRAVLLSARLGLHLDALLDGDPRTIERLKRDAGVSDQPDDRTPSLTIHGFFRRQRFVKQTVALTAVSGIISERLNHPDLDGNRRMPE